MITCIGILSYPGAFPDAKVLQIFSSSLTVVGFKVRAVLLLPERNERKVGLTAGIALASLGPILVKYLQNRLAIYVGSVMDLPSALNDDGRGDLLFRLFMTSFNNFQVNLRSFFALSNFLS